MAETVLTIKAGQTIDQDAGLPGNNTISAIKVDNPSGGPWITFPDVGRIVAPGTNGVVIPYRLKTPRIHVQTVPPSGQQNPTANLPATLTISDQPLSDVAGVAAPLVTTNFATADILVGPNFGHVVTPLGFTANSVVISNPGGQWVTFNNGNGNFVTVPPWTTGYVYVFAKGVTSSDIAAFPPAGQINTGAGLFATVEYTEAILTPSAGVNMAQALNETGSQVVTASGIIFGPSVAGNAIIGSVNVPANVGLLLGFSFQVQFSVVNPYIPNEPSGSYLTIANNGSPIYVNSDSGSPLTGAGNNNVQMAAKGYDFTFPLPIPVVSGQPIQVTWVNAAGSAIVNGTQIAVIFYFSARLV